MSVTLESTVLPFIFLASIGLAIIYNFGSNIFLGEISYLTKAIAAVLQLGVTMDYSIFLYRRYEEEREKHEDKRDAMAGKFDHRHLHTQTNTKKRNGILPGVLYGGNHSLDAPVAKAAGYQNPGTALQVLLQIFLVQRLGVNPPDIHNCVVGNTGMGRGSIVIGLAAVIIGEVVCGAFFRKGSNFAVRLGFIIVGGILYYIVMLEVREVSKTYNPGTVTEQCLFDKFSLSVEDGQFVSIVGSNGSGKTSLLNIICGSIPVESGDVLVGGESISRKKDFQRYITMCERWKTVMSVATGNEGAASHHYHAKLAKKETSTIEFSVTGNPRRLYMTLWKNFADTITFELIAPNGRSTGAIQPLQSITRATLGGTNVSIIYAQPNHYTIMSGTSAAAAITAGACALMMQWGIVQGNDVSISTHQIRAYLIRGCNRMQTVSYPNPQWGYGTLNLFQSFNLMREI